MATGSHAASVERLRAADYRTGQPIFKSRCDACAHNRPPAGVYGLTRYDKRCEHHRAAVKAHGWCNDHEATHP